VRFVDTNVLLYSISSDAAERAKRRRAEQILGHRDIALSVQVLQEFYVQATRASRGDAITHDQAERLVESFTRFHVQSLTLQVVRAAMRSRERFILSYWDAAIVEAARAVGCDVVLTEDLQDGQDLDGITVHNPFV
jgi:predicted nucleic acid-binding protein